MNQVSIKKIEVIKLFGAYSYDIAYKDNKTIEELAILYGDNGCGKTTILKLLYHILSEEPYNNHRTYIGNIVFKEIKIELSDDIIIQLFRDNANNGPYDINVFRNDKPEIEYTWIPDEIKDESHEDKTIYHKFCNFLSSLNLKVFFLQDDRKIFHQDEDSSLHKFYITEHGERIRYNKKRSISNLKHALGQFNQWIKYEALKQTNKGSQNVNELYENIILSMNQKKDTDNLKLDNKLELQNKFNELKQKNLQFIKYGLSSDFLKEEILETILKIKENEVQVINSIINPYLDSFRLRLESLKDLQELIEKLNNYLDNYFKNKKVEININEGIVIKSQNEKPLDPDSLSSGEKQILLLFCHIIVATNKSNLIIIDEPEISLNVKWQRMFLHSLLDLTNNNSQIIIATHSIEMISKYKDKVCPLRDTNE